MSSTPERARPAVGHDGPDRGRPASSTVELRALGEHRFVSLTTFRRSGERVPTPVWIARDGDALIVTTPADSGKVKRVRNDARVELRPCGRFGGIKNGVAPVAGVAEIVTDEDARERLTDIIRTRYGLEYRLVMGIERLGTAGPKPRVVVRITATGP